MTPLRFAFYNEIKGVDKMKKLFILLLLVGGYFGYTKLNENNILKDYSLETFAAEQTQITDELVLVNREHAYDSMPEQLVHIEKGASQLIRVMDSMEMQPDVYEAMIDMAEAATRDGISTLQLNSAYRHADSQAELYEQYGEEYALPAGNSEHQTGLAVDIGTTTGKIEGTVAERWLAKNAASYGFILRYPSHKVNVTKIEFEPWHFRYVGLPHSLIMQEHDLVFEEYIEFLKDNEVIKYEHGMNEYVVQYKKMEKASLELDVPVGQYTKVARDNDGGIIITTLIK